MPHLTLEYTDNLPAFDSAQALRAINQAALDSGLFGENDIKSRALRLDQWRVGITETPRAFLHVRIALLSGRPAEVRQSLAEQVLAALIPTVNRPPGMEIQFSVETADLDRASYAKATVHA